MKVKSEWVKKKWKHPVYSEIILKINTRTVTVTQLAKEFKKTRNALIEQFHVLEQEDYLKRTKKPKGEKNKVYFQVNWEKIVNSFHAFLNEIRPDIPIKKNYAKDKDIQFYFQEIFKGYHQNKFYVPLKNIFENILNSPLWEELDLSTQHKLFIEWAELVKYFEFTDDLYLDVFNITINKLNKRLSQD